MTAQDDAKEALERMRQKVSLLPQRIQDQHYKDYEIVKAALQSAAQPAQGGDGPHSKIDMDIEDALGRELTMEESQIVGLAILGTQQPEKPQWWKDIEWLAELRKKRALTGKRVDAEDENK